MRGANILRISFLGCIPCAGLMCELLWSDPHPGTGRAPSKRGVGVAFGSDVTTRFLEDNNLGLHFLLSL